MNGDQNKQSNLVDTTDCLEAIGVFRGWKNLLFVIVALCLLLLQISFWLVNTECVKAKNETETAFPATVSAEGGPITTAPDIIEEAAQKATATEPSKGTEQAPPPQPAESFLGIKIKHVNWVIRFCNFVLILAAVLYCLTMLFSIKISLIGRLGGINHICRAFFLSLVMLVLLLPWQNFFKCIVVGAIYTPDELVRWCTAESTGIFDAIVRYLRFTGLWALVVLLLVFSQLRSSRWTKAILRRLEVI
ncbi:MAG: hypothetical protein ACETVZ_02595 [Phycisphaerae bacterium]